VSGKEVEHDMAKTTRKTEPTTAEKKPAARRAKAAPAAGVEKVAARRRTKTAAGPALAAEPAGQPNGQGAAQEPTHDEIALRAWSIYLERGASHGQAMHDWLEARAQLCLERGLKP
jgi:hypothetical protein